MSLINRTAVRAFALQALKEQRPALAQQIDRIGSAFFDKIEFVVRCQIRRAINDQPSRGKTLE